MVIIYLLFDSVRCASMTVKTLCLRDFVAIFVDIEVRVYCSACGRSLGHYWAGPVSDQSGVTLCEKQLGGFGRAATREKSSRREGLRGPRTQPGLYPESYGDRTYLRKRCPCRPVHNKLGLGAIGDLPVTVRQEKEKVTLTLAF
jgi:hypothetical protein